MNDGRAHNLPGVEADGLLRWRMGREALVAVVAIVCFVNVLPNGFCYDDNAVVRSSDKVNEPDQWLRVWTTDHWSDVRGFRADRDLLYRPVALSSHRLVRIAGGGGPFPHHLVNVLLHAFVSVLVVRLCLRLGGSSVAALAGGVVFAVMPIHSEVVASVVGRSDMLAAGGVLAAVLCHGRSMVAVRPSRVVGWRLVSMAAVFVAMGSKESGVAVVAIVLLFDAFRCRFSTGRASEGDGGQPDGSLRKGQGWFSVSTLWRLAHLLVPLAVYFALRYHALGGQLYQKPAVSKTVNVLVDAPLWQQAVGVVQLWGMYWAKTLWPGVLSISYSINEIRLATGPADPHVLIGLAVAIALAVASVVAWRRGVRSVAVLSLLIVLSYAPTANALVLIKVFFAERIWYLPSVGAAILLGMGFAVLGRRRWLTAVGVVVVLASMGRCWIRSAEWRDSETLYAAAYRDQPDSITVLHLYGQWLAGNGYCGRGVELLESAVEIDLGFTDGHRALGRACLTCGDYEKALHHLQIAVMQIPDHAPTAELLAVTRRELSATSESEVARLMEEADAHREDVERELAVVRKLHELARDEEALVRFRDRESRFAGSLAWQNAYAVTLLYLNRPDEGIARYRKCVELAPKNAQLVVELAMLLMERREGDDLEEAWELSERALELWPDAWSALVCRAELTALRGDIQAAISLYEKAIRSLPPDSTQRKRLEQRVKALGR